MEVAIGWEPADIVRMTEIESHLRFLYGETTGQQIYPKVRERLRKVGQAGEAAPAKRSRLALTERDALLITYGDQVQQAGVPPLQTLADFLEAHLVNVVSGVHLLPFYPYSSDDGFAVKD